MRLRALFVLMFVLILITSVTAMWVPQNPELVHEGMQLNVEGFLVKIDSIDPDEQMVYVTVKQGVKTIGKGALFPNEPFVLDDTIRISLESFSPIEFYGKQATLNFETYAEGRIVFTNFPNEMHYNSRYPVYAVIENTGDTDARFIVELTEPGNFDRQGRIYQTSESQVVNELIKVDRPLKFIDIPAKSSQRVDWLIGPNRRQNSRTDSIVKIGDVQFNLYAGEQLVDSITLNSIKASTEQSGFIADVYVPPVMIKDVEYDAYTILQNAGDTTGGVNSGRFLFRVTHDDFSMTPSLIREDIQSHTNDEWGFKLRADRPGQHLVSFTLGINNPFNIGERTLDTFTVPITVLDGFTTRIAQVSGPSTVQLGETFKVGAIVENLGNARQLDLVVDSPIFTEIPQQARLTLVGNTVEPVNFPFEATTTGRIPITFTLYDKTGTKENINIDPYSRGKKVDTKTIIITVPEPGSQNVVEYSSTPSTASTPATSTQTESSSSTTAAVVSSTPTEDLPVPKVVIRDEPQVTNNYPDTVPSTSPVTSTLPENWTYIALLIGGILVLLVIVILIIANEFSGKPKRR